jgi:2,4-dienoyl-CoA reductase-like NADH-dependent reductase (Old Yellow Enzyme family)
MTTKYPKIAQLKSVADFREHCGALKIDIPIDDEVLTRASGSVLADSLQIGRFEVGNRFCIHPMEGWDARRDGTPSDLTVRRWQNFGRSGAKLIWGAEAAAVRHDGRANPNQLMALRENRDGLRQLLQALQESHRASGESTDDLLVGLQLTHSGRFCRPNSKQLEPRIAYHHPLLDEKFGIDPHDQSIVWSDDDLEQLVDDYVAAAKVAQEAGFRFVDVKACHGYLLHEFLSARIRPGKYGGDLEGRTRLLRTIIGRVQEACPELMVLVRLSIFDVVPFRTSTQTGEPMSYADLQPYELGFGTDPENPLDFDLAEPLLLIDALQQAGVAAINISCGSPYYNPHIQRPAIFPPSDGYLPPEDPLVGVARQIDVSQQCKAAFPHLPMIGSGYSYLQDYLPHVAQAVIKSGWIDSVGLGRMVLSYPELPADVLATGRMARKKICRTFSDCTTAPRHGLVSGCYPLDETYKSRPEFEQLKAMKKSLT